MSKYQHIKAWLTKPSTEPTQNEKQYVTGTDIYGDKHALDIANSTSFLDQVVLNNISGVRSFTKFGYRATLQAASGEQTIWSHRHSEHRCDIL